MTALQTDTTTSPSLLNGIVVVLLFDFQPQFRSWAWLKLIQGTNYFYKTLPGLLFAKVMGSGEGGGFGLRPSGTHRGLIFLFDSLKSACDYLNSPDAQLYRDKSREWWQGLLVVNSCRGTWNSQGWQSQGFLDELEVQNYQGPVASLTRGSIRASKAPAFWRYTPAAQEDLHQALGCELAVGLGEAPVVRQCTFSVWDNTASMMNYSRQGAHMKAIAAANKHQFFTESMFVRMQILQMVGEWKGRIFNTTSKVVEPFELRV